MGHRNALMMQAFVEILVKAFKIRLLMLNFLKLYLLAAFSAICPYFRTVHSDSIAFRQINLKDS